MGRPSEADLQDAVDEADFTARLEGLTDPTAITERAVQIIMQRYPHMTAAEALANFRRLRAKG